MGIGRREKGEGRRVVASPVLLIMSLLKADAVAIFNRPLCVAIYSLLQILYNIERLEYDTHRTDTAITI